MSICSSSSSLARRDNSCLIIKYVVPRQTKPRILKLTIKRGQSNFSIVLAAKKKAIIQSRLFRTPQFWLALIMGATAVCKDVPTLYPLVPTDFMVTWQPSNLRIPLHNAFRATNLLEKRLPVYMFYPSKDTTLNNLRLRRRDTVALVKNILNR